MLLQNYQLCFCLFPTTICRFLPGEVILFNLLLLVYSDTLIILLKTFCNYYWEVSIIVITTTICLTLLFFRILEICSKSYFSTIKFIHLILSNKAKILILFIHIMILTHEWFLHTFAAVSLQFFFLKPLLSM